MTFCSTYIGDLDDPNFSWEGGDWNGNIPAALGKEFPRAREHYNRKYHEWIEISEVECRQTDFDGFVAKVSKTQIQNYIAYCYDDDPSYTEPNRASDWDINALAQLREFVETLENEKTYALVAESF